MNPLQELISKHREIDVAKDKGWEKKSGKTNPLKLGAKHASRVAAKRAIKASLGNNLLSDVLGMLVSRSITKI